jgi:hypothetical protein
MAHLASECQEPQELKATLEPLAPPVQKEIRAQRGPLEQRELPEPLGQQGRPAQQAQQDLKESSGLTFWARGRPRRSSIMLQRMML